MVSRLWATLLRCLCKCLCSSYLWGIVCMQGIPRLASKDMHPCSPSRGLLSQYRVRARLPHLCQHSLQLSLIWHLRSNLQAIWRLLVGLPIPTNSSNLCMLNKCKVRFFTVSSNYYCYMHTLLTSYVIYVLLTMYGF